MKTLQFKTNIKCSGCVAKVTPHLDAVAGIEKWEVDVLNPNKVLTVVTADDKADKIQQVVQQAGFKAEVL